MRHLLYLKFHKFINAENEEQDVKHVGSDLSPPERVQQAIECLPLSSDKELNSSSFPFRYWTILDYSRAYTSGEMTPQLVRHVFSIFWINGYEQPLLPTQKNCFQSELVLILFRKQREH